MYDGKAQAGSAGIARARGIRAVEALEDVGGVLRRHSLAVIDDVYQDVLVVAAQLQGDRGILAAVAQAIGNQVEQHLVEAVCIAIDHGDGLRIINHLDLAFGEGSARGRAYRKGKLQKIHRPQV